MEAQNAHLPQDAGALALGESPLLEVRGLKVYFPFSSRVLRTKGETVLKAVDDVSFTLSKGETLGLVGESGSGKTTLGLSILQLQRPTAGQILFEGRDLTIMSGGDLRRSRRQMQIIFQDPFGSLNPRMKVGRAVAEPLVVHDMAAGSELEDRVAELFSTVGLNTDMIDRYPHEFSGGQRQRIGIARALALQPRLIVCDEAVSALDVSVQAQVVNLLEDLQDQFDLTYLFIGHDLSVVRHIADRIAVMYLGKIVEIADRDELFRNPAHPYTRALISALPIPDPRVEALREHVPVQGEVPSPVNRPSGCAFHPRCPLAVEDCKSESPHLREAAPERWVACIRPFET